MLVDAAARSVETSIIIEYLGIHHPGPVRLVPEPAEAALDVRMMDRVFDNYVMTPMQKIVVDFILRPRTSAIRHGVADARQLLETAYRWLDGRMAGREWATAAGFSLADCAAAPALFYADWVHPIATTFAQSPLVPATPAGATVVRARRRRGAAVPRTVPARCAGSRLITTDQD